MNWQQIATLIFLIAMITFSIWAYRESSAYQKEQKEKELSSEKAGTERGSQKQKKQK